MSKVKNKVTFGLKNVYYSKITETNGANGVEVEYATPISMPGGASMSMPKNAERVAIAADDDPEYAVFYNNKGYDGNIVLYDVPDSFYTDCLGETSDGNTMVENKDAQPSPFALLFEFSGDKHSTKHVFYRCLATQPDVASETKGESITANQITLNIKATPALDTGNIKRKCSDMESDTYRNWYKSVPVSGGTASGTSSTEE